MEPVRRKALVDAALSVIGDRGRLSVTMSEIAERAGVSAALAHHYFGSKDQLMVETVKSLLDQLRADTLVALTQAEGPRARVSALVRVSFHAGQFAPETIAAWLAFYGEAQSREDMRRLLVVYARRLHSNLVASLKPLCGAIAAGHVAEGTAAMIDGLYLRKALGSSPLSIEEAIALTEDYIDSQLSRHGATDSSAGQRNGMEDGQ